MSETLYSSGMLNSSAGLVLAGVVGYFFGSFLEKAGFGSSRKLTGIFYFRDMAVLKVMFSAVVTALVGYHYMVALGWIVPGNVHALDTFWVAQIVGGLIFGAGFVIGGWCPGTAFAGLASAKWDALVFLIGAAVGSIVFNEAYLMVEPLYKATHAGVLNLPESLGLSKKVFPLIFCIVAVAAFAGSTLAERKFGKKGADEQGSRARQVFAAAILLVAACGIIFLQEPQATSEPVNQPAATFLAEVANAEEHIEPEDVASRLMADPTSLVLVDIRDATEYITFHPKRGSNGMET